MSELKVWTYRAMAALALLAWFWTLTKLADAGEAQQWGAVIYRAILAILTWISARYWWALSKRERKNKSEGNEK